MITIKQEQIPNEVAKVFVCGGGRVVDETYWKDANELGRLLGSMENVAYANGGLSDKHTMMCESYRGYVEAGGKYSVFVNTMYNKNIKLDRKVLSNIAVAFPVVFDKMYDEIMK